MKFLVAFFSIVVLLLALPSIGAADCSGGRCVVANRTVNTERTVKVKRFSVSRKVVRARSVRR